VSELNNSKQSGGSMLENPTIGLSATIHTTTVAHVAYHPEAPRIVTIGAEAPASLAAGGGQSAARGGRGRDDEEEEERRSFEEKYKSRGLVKRSAEEDIQRHKHEVPVVTEIRLWNNKPEARKPLGAPLLTSAKLSGPQALVLAACVLQQVR